MNTLCLLYFCALSTELQDTEQDSPATAKDHIYDNDVQISVSSVFNVNCYRLYIGMFCVLEKQEK